MIASVTHLYTINLGANHDGIHTINKVVLSHKDKLILIRESKKTSGRRWHLSGKDKKDSESLQIVPHRRENMNRGLLVWICLVNLGEQGGVGSGRQEMGEWVWFGTVHDSCSCKPRLMKGTEVKQIPK